MLIPILLPAETRLWDLYLDARARGGRLITKGFDLYMEVEL